MKRLITILTIIYLIGFCIPFSLSLTGILPCDYTNDFIHQQLPFIYEYKNLITSGGFGWSWNTYLGDNALGAYSYYGILSPLNLLCALLPEGLIGLGYLAILYIRILLLGVCSFLYFKRMNVSVHNATLGGILYTFSSFFIINMTYGMFDEAMIMFPLLLLGIEYVLDKRHYSVPLLATITFATIALQYYFAVSSLICAYIYLICRIIAVKKYRSFSNLITPTSAIIYGIMMSAVILIPTALHIMGGNRGAIAQFPTFSEIILASLGHLLWAIIPKVTEGVPLSFIFGTLGSITIFIQIFGITFATIYSIRKKDWITLYLTIIAILYFTPLNGLFTFFTSFLYCRWGYCIILIMILATIKCIDQNIVTKKDANISIAASIAFLLFMTILTQYFLWKSGRGIGFNYRGIIELSLGLINFILLFQLTRTNARLHNRSVLYVTIASILNLTAGTWMLSRGNKIQSDGYDDVEKLREYVIKNHIPYNDIANSKYRTDILCHYFSNHNLFTNRPSITFYHSLFNKNITEFADYTANDNVWAETRIHIPRESLAALLSVKDVYRFDSFSDWERDYDHGLSYNRDLGNVKEYTFDYSIPMGMVYDSYITKSQLDSIRAADKDADLCLMMLDNIVIEDTDESEINKYLRKASINTDISLDSIARLRNKNTVDFTCDANGYRLMTNASTHPGMAFISTPRDDGFSAQIDGNPTKIFRVNIGMSGIITPPGKHEITVDYTAPGLKAGATITSISATILVIATLISSRRYRCRRDRRGGFWSH